jgi:hypothetical protein
MTPQALRTHIGTSADRGMSAHWMTMTDRMGLQVRAAGDRPDHVPRRLRASPTLGAGVPGRRCTCGAYSSRRRSNARNRQSNGTRARFSRMCARHSAAY